MRLNLFPTGLALALALSACSEPEEALPDVSWDPELGEDNSTTIDLGIIEQGDSVVTIVTGTNNSIEAIEFSLNCNFDNGGFLVPGCPAEQTVEPGESTVPVSATLATNLSGQYSGSFQFIFNDEIATFIIEGIVQ